MGILHYFLFFFLLNMPNGSKGSSYQQPDLLNIIMPTNRKLSDSFWAKKITNE